MTETAWVILVSYTALTVIGVAVALIVFRSTRVGFRAEPSERAVLERGESMWAIAFTIFLVVLLALTIFEVPYLLGSDKQGDQKLDITGQQFAWTVKPPIVKAGVKTLVSAHSKDVSHAVGLYNPADELIKQVNVLPGVDQEFTVTFSRPGKYKLLCLEFCGLDHHKMETVVEAR